MLFVLGLVFSSCMCSFFSLLSSARSFSHLVVSSPQLSLDYDNHLFSLSAQCTRRCAAIFQFSNFHSLTTSLSLSHALMLVLFIFFRACDHWCLFIAPASPVLSWRTVIERSPAITGAGGESFLLMILDTLLWVFYTGWEKYSYQIIKILD